MSATDVIAAVALGIAGLSAGLAILSLVLAFRESSRRDEEIAHLRREGERREEELSLLRQQVAADREERLRQQQARISVGEQVPASGSERSIDYRVTVQNTGTYPATDVVVELVNAVGVSAGSGRLDSALIAGDSDVVNVETPPRGRYTGPYKIVVAWTDGRGPNREVSSVEVGAP